MSRRSVYRWSAHAPIFGLGAVVVCALTAGALLVGSTSAAGTLNISVKVSPNHGLVNGQVVSVSGKGLARSENGANVTWFVTECTAAVRGRMNPTTDTPHCNVTDAQAIRVSANGSFQTRFHVRTGIVGDGYCGTTGHPSCVIGVGNARGQGTVVRITFATPPTTPTTSASSATAP